MENRVLAEKIVNLVGGKDNIAEVYHCVTRLRFYLKDKNVVDIENIRGLKGVMGVQYHTDQLQIIIGNDVNVLYGEVAKIVGEGKKSKEKRSDKFKITDIFETMAAIFLPTIPVLAGTGMIKGVITIMTQFMGFDSSSDVIMVLNIAGDCIMYFFPFIVAWSAANRFKTDVGVALALAGVLMYPTMTAGFANGLEPMKLFGLSIPFVRYSGSSIPIILSVLAMKYVYDWVNKIVPKMLRLVFTPMFVILIMVPLVLIGIAPLANYISQGLVSVVWFLYNLSPMLAGTIVGATRMLVVLTGMHLSLGVIIIENVANFGTDFLLPMNTMGTMALFGACMAVWIKSKNEETKSIGATTAFSAFIGITEPGIYGVFLKFRNAMIATMVGGAAGGAIVGAFGGRSTAYVNSSIMSLPVFMGEGFWAVCLGMAVATVVAFVVVMILGVSEENKTEDEIMTNSNNVLTSPMSGKIIKLSEVDESIFSSGEMGKGIAIDPTDKHIVAPFNGTITAIYPTKHAIGVTSNDGVECIIHVGINTAELRGKFFDVKVEVGDIVKAGDIILEAEIGEILKAGYSLVTPIIVTNSANYLDVIPVVEDGIIGKNENLLMIVK